MEYTASDTYKQLNGVSELPSTYCIRKVWLINKQTVSNGVWGDDYNDPIIRCYEIQDENDHVLISPKHFKFTLFGGCRFLYDVASTLEQLCNAHVPFDENYKLISNKTFEIIDTDDVTRTFVYDVKQIDDTLFSMVVRELIQYSHWYELKPLQYALTMTNKYVSTYERSFIKCLELNDIKIKEGKFDNLEDE